MNLLRPTHITIDLQQLRHNFRQLKKLTPVDQSFICPMIKANAYGHGDVYVARALVEAGCEYLGVACVEEALVLFEAGVHSQILVFGFYGKEAAQEIIARGFIPVISNQDQLSHITSLAKKRFPVHVKLNTGMNRLGFDPTQWESLLTSLATSPQLQIQGLLTHLHSGEDICAANGSASVQQLTHFAQGVKLLGSATTQLHAYNSAAIASLYGAQRPFTYGFRPGLLVYGIDPSPENHLSNIISPVMSFKSKIVATQAVKSGDVVSYGGAWVAPQDTLIGVVPAGYGDGVSRSLSNKGHVIIRGKKHPIRGRVCMDYTMVDLGPNSSLSWVGEEVVFIGQQGNEKITVQDLAQLTGLVNYELMTSISERVPRLITGESVDT
jgi:alanine racemase